ncbi:unnamed protein product [Owenia fusiformis]|nr:unnamed protein product [Owenia fusiformis]
MMATDRDNDTIDPVSEVRHQGDGESSREYIIVESRSDPYRVKPFSVNMEVDLMQLNLFIVALVSRFWMIEHPKAVVFDELHFNRFAGMYMNRVFFFDVHPPLGKLLIAGCAYLAGFDGLFKFEKIGQEYMSNVPIWHLRALPAMLGSLTVPVTYQIIVEMGLSRYAASLAAFLIIFDNAMLTQSRFVLMEGILVFFISISILCLLKFRKQNQRELRISSMTWLALLGISIAATMSVKYIGVFTGLLALGVVLRDNWSLVSDKSLTEKDLLKLCSARAACLIMLPCLLYMTVFGLHLGILTKAGPHDDIMTSAFQASLEGGLAAITKGQPLEISYGSQVTLRSTHGKPCWIHSHNHVYPVRYSDNRGSSHQQQVTCYTFKDVNNWWIVKHPSRNSLVVDEPREPVQDGDIVQLVHGMSSRGLNSHDVAAPLTPQCQEVSCYIDYNISTPAQNLWRVEIVNANTEGEVWHTIKSHVRLIHVNTTAALKLTGRQLPEWGFNQYEVAADRDTHQDLTIWNVEEHRYTRSPDEEGGTTEMTQAEMIPLHPTQLSFWQKFLELQVKMLTSQLDAPQDHKYSSEPTEWPLMDYNVAYWLDKDSNAQIHLIGNPVIWFSCVLGVFFYLGLIVFYMLRRQRLCFDVPEGEWQRFLFTGVVFLSGYFFNYLPYCLMDTKLFLHNYLPAVYFKILSTVAVLDHLYHIAR